MLRTTWDSIVGGHIPDVHWDMACLPVRNGGLGIQDPTTIHPFAAVSSFIQAVSSKETTGMSFRRFPEDLEANMSCLTILAPVLADQLHVAMGVTAGMLTFIN